MKHVNLYGIGKKKFPKVVVKLLVVDAFERLLVREPIRIMFPYEMYRELKVPTMRKTYIIVFLARILNSFFYVIGGWLADSYVGKYGLFIIGMFMETFCAYPFLGAASIGHLFTDSGNRMLIFFMGYTMFSISQVGSICRIPMLSEQFSMPEDIEGLTNFYYYDYWILNFCYVTDKLILSKIFNTDFCKGYSCYSAIYFLGLVGNCVYMILLIKFRKEIKDRKIKQRAVEKCVKVTCQAIKAQCCSRRKKSEIRKHQTGFDIIEDENNRTEVADTKTILGIFSIVLPCFAYYAARVYLSLLYVALAYHMDLDFVMFSADPEQLVTAKNFASLLLLPICLKLIYPLLNKFNLVFSKLVSIGIAFLLLAMSFLIAGYILVKIKQDFWQKFTKNEAYVVIYNTLNTECNIYSNWTGEFKLDQMEMKIFRNDTGKLWNGSELYINCSGFKSWHDYEPFGVSNERYFSFVIMNKTINELAVVQESMKLFPKLEPCIQFYCGFWPNCPPGQIEIVSLRSKWFKMEKIPESGRSVSIELPEAGMYKLNIAGTNIRRKLFKTGALYSLMIYRIVENKTDIRFKRYEMIPPYSIHLSWIIPQIIMDAIADILAYVNIRVFLYTQSPTTLRAFTYSVLGFISTVGHSSLSFIYSPKEIVRFHQYHFAVIMISFLLIYIYSVKRYKLRTIYEEVL